MKNLILIIVSGALISSAVSLSCAISAEDAAKSYLTPSASTETAVALSFLLPE